jgi:DNA repair/transcription protein MET18/MMS19
LFVQGDLSEIGSTSNQPFEPLKSTASLEQQKTSQIFASIIASLRKDVRKKKPY